MKTIFLNTKLYYENDLYLWYNNPTIDDITDAVEESKLVIILKNSLQEVVDWVQYYLEFSEIKSLPQCVSIYIRHAEFTESDLERHFLKTDYSVPM